jgi:hypothetical protein
MMAESVNGILDGSMIIDGEWGIATVSWAAYEILKMYYTVATDIKEWMSATDSLQNYPIPFHVLQIVRGDAR